MNIDYARLAQALDDKKLLGKPLEAMTKEEITELCKIVCFFAQPLGSEDVPF